MSRDELIAGVGAQAERIARQDGQIIAMAEQMAELIELNEALVDKLTTLQHLLSRNSSVPSHPIRSGAGI